MTTHAQRYKETRLQQLRSFCETARLGSLAAAAKSLRLAQPTVWKQVHALEAGFDAKLVEPYGRGCRLTPEGAMLAELAAPSVAGIDELRRCFDELRAPQSIELTIAATQRVLADDLPRPLDHFQRAHPHVRFRLLSVRNTEVVPLVENGAADLGLTGERPPRLANPWLVFERAYALELMLVAPRNHPLARKRNVALRDLAKYPLVNAPGSLLDPELVAAIDKLGLFEHPHRRIETTQARLIHRYVEQGFGIGLIACLAAPRSSGKLHFRSLGNRAVRPEVFFVWRKGRARRTALFQLVQMIRTETANRR